MINRLNLYDLDGNKLDLYGIGLFGFKLQIPSPSYSIESEQVDGGGIVVLDKFLNSRNLTADFMTKATDYVDSLTQKTLLYELIGNGKEFYIEQTHRPNIVWKCHLDEWIPEHFGSRITTFSIPLICMSGQAESVNLIKKKFTSTSFIFKNEGNRIIDPRKQSETEIEFKGASYNLTITNNTTGDVWKYNGNTTNLEIIKLKGVQASKGTLSIFGQTNKKLLSFAVGNNDFSVSGASGEFELTISTRFYFL
jgi:hypothetical protein